MKSYSIIKSIVSIWLLTAGIAVSGQSLAFAQTNTQTNPRRPNAERLEALKQKIETLKYKRLKETLGMDDAEATKFFEKYRPAEKDIQDLVKQRNQELQRLYDMMKGAKTDADVDPEMDKVREISQKIQARQQELDADLKPVLSPRQRARLMVFEQEFNRRVREEVIRHRIENVKRQGALREKLHRIKQEKHKAEPERHRH